MDHNLSNLLMPVSILGTLGTVVIYFTRLITDYVLKKKMIDKGYVNEETQSIFKQYGGQSTTENKYSSLKWGLILFCGGLSLVGLEFIDYDERSTLPYGLLAVSISAGFLLYYALVKKDLK